MVVFRTNISNISLYILSNLLVCRLKPMIELHCTSVQIIPCTGREMGMCIVGGRVPVFNVRNIAGVPILQTLGNSFVRLEISGGYNIASEGYSRCWFYSIYPLSPPPPPLGRRVELISTAGLTAGRGTWIMDLFNFLPWVQTTRVRNQESRMSLYGR